MPRHLEDQGYWMTYFAVRIAATLKEIRDKQIRASMREDLNDFLRSSVPGERTRDIIRKEMRR